MLGLVDGPGLVLGVGLVVLGVSVPVPPMLAPPSELLLDAPPEVLPGIPLEVPLEVPPDMPPEAPLDSLPDAAPEVSGAFMPPDMPELPEVPDVPSLPPPLDPELPLVPASEPPPVMPAHALNSIAQAIGNIHLVIEHSR